MVVNGKGEYGCARLHDRSINITVTYTAPRNTTITYIKCNIKALTPDI